MCIRYNHLGVFSQDDLNEGFFLNSFEGKRFAATFPLSFLLFEWDLVAEYLYLFQLFIIKFY